MTLRKVLSGVALAGSLYSFLCGCSVVEFSTASTPNILPYIGVGVGLSIISIILDKPATLIKHVAATTICVKTMCYKLGHKSKSNRRCYKIARQLGSYAELYSYVVEKYDELDSSDESTIFYM